MHDSDGYRDCRVVRKIWYGSVVTLAIRARSKFDESN
jgi:hypothetical protein